MYTVDDLRPFVNVLTQLMIKETMLSTSEQTEEAALLAVGAVAKCLVDRKSVV